MFGNVEKNCNFTGLFPFGCIKSKVATPFIIFAHLLLITHLGFIKRFRNYNVSSFEVAIFPMGFWVLKL